MKRRKYLRERRLYVLEAPTSDNKRIAKNTIVMYFRMMAVMAIGFFTSRVQLDVLGVTDYGLYNVAAAVVGMCVFLNGTLATASSRFITVEMGKGTIGSLKRVFSTLFYVHLMLAGLAAIILETIGLYVLQSKLNIDPSRLGAVMWTYHCVVIMTVLSITQVPYSAVIIAHERMSAFAWMVIFDVATKLLAVYVLVVSPFDKLKTYAVLLLLFSFITILIYRLYCIRHFTEARIRRVFDKHLLKPVFSFAGWQSCAAVIIMLFTQGVTMINQRYFGPTLVAATAIAIAAQGHVMGFVNNLKAAATPQIVKLFSSGDREGAKKLLIETTLFTVFLLAILGTPVLIYAEELLNIWLVDVPEYAATILRLCLGAALFSIFDTSFYIILYATGNMRANALTNLAVAGSFIFSIFICIYYVRWPLTAAVGLAIETLSLGLICKPLLLHYCADYHWKDFWQIFKPTLILASASAVIGCTIKTLLPSSLWGTLFGAAFIAIAITLFIFFVIATQAQRTALLKLGNRVPFLRKYLSR